MKTNVRSNCRPSLWLGAISAALALSAQAGDQGFYATANMGVSIAQDVAIREVIVPVSGAKTDYDPGAFFSVSGGFRCTPWLSVEAETGVTANSFANGDAALAQVPLLGNLVIHGRDDAPFRPFIGGGAGVSFSVLELDRVSIAGSPLLDGTDSDAVFAYQGFAGFTVALNRRMSIGAVYKFLGTDAPNWDVSGGGRIRFDKARVHSIGVNFTFRF